MCDATRQNESEVVQISLIFANIQSAENFLTFNMFQCMGSLPIGFCGAGA